MNSQEKFFTDAKKCIKRSETAKKASDGIIALFISQIPDMKIILESLAGYWRSEYIEEYIASTNDDERYKIENHIDWLCNILDLLNGNFDETQNFPKKDWGEIRDCINAEAGDMDIAVLSAVLSILTERKVL